MIASHSSTSLGVGSGFGAQNRPALPGSTPTFLSASRDTNPYNPLTKSSCPGLNRTSSSSGGRRQNKKGDILNRESSHIRPHTTGRQVLDCKMDADTNDEGWIFSVSKSILYQFCLHCSRYRLDVSKTAANVSSLSFIVLVLSLTPLPLPQHSFLVLNTESFNNPNPNSLYDLIDCRQIERLIHDLRRRGLPFHIIEAVSSIVTRWATSKNNAQKISANQVSTSHIFSWLNFAFDCVHYPQNIFIVVVTHFT